MKIRLKLLKLYSAMYIDFNHLNHCIPRCHLLHSHIHKEIQTRIAFKENSEFKSVSWFRVTPIHFEFVSNSCGN